MKFSLKRNKFDYIVTTIIVFLVTIMICCSFYLKADSKNSMVSIKYYNKEVYRMSLAKDEVFVMTKKDYDKLLGDLTVEVKNGKVRVKSETSDKNYCSLMGFQDSKGTSIICAPNGVVVTIEGKRDDGLDWVPGGAN